MESTSTHARHEQAGAEPGAAPKAPPLDESLRRIGQEAKAGLGAGVDTLRALRKLVVADFALARVALARAAVWLAVTAVFGASSWLLLMATLIATLRGLAGLSWLASLAIAAALSLAVTVLGVWQVARYFDMSRMEATRRQLRALGLGTDDEDDPPGGGDAPGAPADAAAPAAAPAEAPHPDADLDHRVRRAAE